MSVKKAQSQVELVIIHTSSSSSFAEESMGDIDEHVPSVSPLFLFKYCVDGKFIHLDFGS
jgi:hypothetical protein